MSRTPRVIGTWLGGMLIVCLVAALVPDVRCGGEAAHAFPETSVTAADLVLTMHEGLLSLRAQNASLKGIFEAIGRQLSIDVVTRIPAGERITIAFDQLSLTEALKRFRPSVRYMALEDAAKAPGTIRKLIVVSQRVTGGPAHPTIQSGDAWALPDPSQGEASTPAAPARPKPFSFEFDPTAVGERGR